MSSPADEPMDDEAADDELMDDDAADDEPMDEDATDEDATDEDATDDDATSPGIYRDYTEEAVGEAGYTTTILFFYAQWCPECRAFEQAIEQGDLPDGVQILKIDYDSATDLRQRYDVTMQTTFVRVDESGEPEGTWVGYGKDRSIEAIMNELG